MKPSLIIPAALAMCLAASTACAQPAGGIGTSTGPSGGVVGAGTLSTSTPGSGTIGSSGTTGSSGIGTSSSPSTLPGSNENLGAMPPTTSTGTVSAPNQSPSGSVPAATP